jgi:hypothetical protein
MLRVSESRVNQIIDSAVPARRGLQMSPTILLLILSREPRIYALSPIITATDLIPAMRLPRLISLK